jgi:hypothetical protein
LLAIVSLLGFVGCVLQTGGLPVPVFTDYTAVTVLGNPNVVAFWPLNDAANSAQAVELKAGNNGNYITATSNPTQFPDPPVANVSAPAPGALSWGQPGIVAGDCIGGDQNNRTPCINVNGGYISVPHKAAFNPPTSFTVEAWVRVDWNETDPVKFPPAFRVVVDSRDVSGNSTMGFALFATPDNHWAVAIGSGAAGLTILTGEKVSLPVGNPAMNVTSYVAATYDGASKTLTLFVDGIRSSPAMSPVDYVANTTAPLFIGTGSPWEPLRPQPPNVPVDQTAPLAPFFGEMQDVAVYNVALPGGNMDANDVIFTHAQNGNGTNVS